jgi:hypothetical protein
VLNESVTAYIGLTFGRADNKRRLCEVVARVLKGGRPGEAT